MKEIKIRIRTFGIIVPFIVFVSCTKNHFVSSSSSPDIFLNINVGEVFNTDYIGNGVEWDPYSLDYGNGPVEISQDDWEKLYSRLDAMKPSFIRMMHNISGKLRNGNLDTSIGFDHLTKLLDYCQSRNITVVFGDWGGGLVDPLAMSVNDSLIAMTSEYMRFLIQEKGYSCIKYFNIINEPNGHWATTKGSFDLWVEAVKSLFKAFVKEGIEDDITIIGPDIAIWSDRESWWISGTSEELQHRIGLYDIHTYPSKYTINTGEYGNIISAYKKCVPEGCRIVIGEIGIKYVAPEDSEFNENNIRRAQECPHASKTDSQMSVYDHHYGTDMADALFQTINAGYSGSIVWMLDDAMHNHETKNRLKIWGFWNILGDELFGSDEEKVRPWFYAWSLLCRYIPKGSDFNEVTISDENKNLYPVRAISAQYKGHRTIAMVNSSLIDHTVAISASLKQMKNVSVYIYSEGGYLTDGDCRIVPDQENVIMDFRHEIKIDLPAESMIVITDMIN